jgi:RNA polymerase sigma-70 factor (ECF subfamily)
MHTGSIPEYTGEGAAFCTTRWSVVLATKDAASPEAHRALSDLCRSYWYPLYLFVRRTRDNAHDAEDLVQSFFEQLVEQGTMAQADANLGRFRAFLLARLKDFLITDWRKAKRLKRGGGEAPLSVDDPAMEERVRLELAEEQTPATLFDRAWAATLLDRAIARAGGMRCRRQSRPLCDAEGLPHRRAR